MVPRIDIFAPTASGLEASVLVAAAAGAGAGRGAELDDITNYSTPFALQGLRGSAVFPGISSYSRPKTVSEGRGIALVLKMLHPRHEYLFYQWTFRQLHPSHLGTAAHDQRPEQIVSEEQREFRAIGVFKIAQ